MTDGVVLQDAVVMNAELLEVPDVTVI